MKEDKGDFDVMIVQRERETDGSRITESQYRNTRLKLVSIIPIRGLTEKVQKKRETKEKEKKKKKKRKKRGKEGKKIEKERER